MKGTVKRRSLKDNIVPIMLNIYWPAEAGPFTHTIDSWLNRNLRYFSRMSAISRFRIWQLHLLVWHWQGGTVDSAGGAPVSHELRFQGRG
ncbi:MAG: hypothetical protein MK102_14360 [Fuerstiella sp.]|nr:hypothetical protein [Fuerstiella sp.]